MKEIITLHFGQTGVQIGDPYWRMMCSEHNIEIDGSYTEPRVNIKSAGDMCSELFSKHDIEEGNKNSVFQETPRGNYTSRSIFIDPDPDTIATFKRYHDYGLYSKSRYISSNDSCSNLFAKGQGSIYTTVKSKITETIRHVLEHCDSPEGFLALCSLGGGTGSGLSVSLLNLLQNHYRKLAQVQLTVFPTPKASIVEPYNCGLHEYIMCGYQRAVLLVDNDALNYALRLMRRPNEAFYSVNSLIAQLASSITVGTRFKDSTMGTMGIRELQFLLNPTEGIKFASAAFSPNSSNWATTFDKLDEIRLTGDCFSNNNQLISYHGMGLEPNLGTCMIYRGDVDYFKARDSIAACINRIPGTFMTGFNLCVAHKQPTLLKEVGIIKAKKSACRFSNNLGMKQLWENTYNNYKKLFDKKAFVHWFENEGMSVEELKDGLESLLSLIDEYRYMLGK